MLDDLRQQMGNDVETVFLTNDMSVEAVYKSNSIRIQFFEEQLDKMETTYFHAWGSSNDLPDVKKNDILIIDNVSYGIVDYGYDEFRHGVNMFLQKVF